LFFLADVNKTAFFGFRDGNVRRGSLLSIITPTFIKRYRESQKSGLEGNLQGDGSILGGLLLMKPGNEGIWYEYPERDFGDHVRLVILFPFVSKVYILETMDGPYTDPCPC
jgi:hypothetical protein